VPCLSRLCCVCLQFKLSKMQVVARPRHMPTLRTAVVICGDFKRSRCQLITGVWEQIQREKECENK
jgi:hypothetical protein